MPSQRGFTLIEILVVVLIISITLGFAMLSFGDFGEKRRIITAARHFAHYISYVRQEAMLESSTLGVRVNQQGYEALRLREPNRWQSIRGVFHYQAFPTHMILQVKQPHQVNRAPMIIIDAAGDMTPFAISFGTTQQPQLIDVIGKIDGSIKVIAHDAK